jgi:yeast amino acid transporter
MKTFLVESNVGLGRLIGFWSCCCKACFSYVGSEIIGITANEVERPRETLPKAVRRVSWRLVFLYVGAVFILGVNIASTDPQLKGWLEKGDFESPFVLMVRRANIPVLDNLLNAVILMSAITLANVNLYVTVSLGLVAHNNL